MGNIKNIVQDQHDYFRNGSTLNYDFRKQNLEKLKTMLQKNEQKIYAALKQDLNKSTHETFTTEIVLRFFCNINCVAGLFLLYRLRCGFFFTTKFWS